MKIYHGSYSLKGLPTYGVGRPYNDYGLGFYCTDDIDLAKEWSLAKDTGEPIVDIYELNMDELKILDLTSDEYDVLNWIAILLKNRDFELEDMFSISVRDFIIDHYYIDVSQFDVIIGYRADDSYFRYAEDFVNNRISKDKLEFAMRLGNLGTQIVLISEKACKSLVFLGFENVDRIKYHQAFMKRDQRARYDYHLLRGEIDAFKDETFIIDIIRKESK